MSEKITLDGLVRMIKNSGATGEEKSRMENYVKDLFGIDEQTQVHNRNFLISELGNMIAESRRAPETDLSLSLYDLDNFGLINKRYDMTKGDRMLWEFSKVLGKHIPRSTDVIAKTRHKTAGGYGKRSADSQMSGRYGGEEFVSVHPKMKKEDVRGKIAEEIRRDQEKNAIEYVIGGKKIYLGTVSIGIGSVDDIEQIKILYTRDGNKLLLASLDGKYSDMIKSFSRKTGISDEKIDEHLKRMDESAEEYLHRGEIYMPVKEALGDEKYGPQLRNYLGAIGFISEVDMKGLQVSKRGKNTITLL